MEMRPRPERHPARCRLIGCALLLGLGLTAALPGEEITANRWAVQGNGQGRPDGDGVLFRSDSPQAQLVFQPNDGRPWDFSHAATLQLEVENRSDARQLRLNVRLRADRELVCGAALNPHERRIITIRLPHRGAHRLPAGVPGPTALDTARVEAIDLYLQWPFERTTPGLIDCRVSGLRLEGTPAPPPEPAEAKDFFPFVDIYGQNVHATWPEKIANPAQLSAARSAEQAAIATRPRPAGWDEFGGWKDGPQLPATGSFRTIKHQGRWWLVDPAGRLFFSHGIDVLQVRSDSVRTGGHENWYPAGVPTPSWQPFSAILRQKYGDGNVDATYLDVIDRRLGHWGMNSIGNWADHRLMRLGRTPYTLELTQFDPTQPHIGSFKFYDVWDPVWVERMRRIFEVGNDAELLRKSITDPYCIGYFIDNELAFRDAPKLVAEILRSPPTLAAKRACIDWLRARHGTIAALNAAWGTAYPGWDEMRARAIEVQRDREGCQADVRDFALAMFERYFSVCRDAVKSAAPDRLYLGCRFIGTDAVGPGLPELCAKYCDVLSANIYAHTPANLPVEGYPDMPVLVGEFHFGISDRGLFQPGLCIAGTTPADRGLAYTRFLQGALAHPNIVGAHWFQYRDQPLTGRFDGEGYQIGFIDVADTPYPEMTAAARAVGEGMYRYRMAGKLSDAMVPAVETARAVVRRPAEPLRAPPPPAPVPRPEARQDFLGRLRASVVAAAAAGRGPIFRFAAVGGDATIEGLDGDAMTVRAGQTVLFHPWSKLDDGELLAIALALARSGSEADAALAAFWLRCAGREDEARLQLARAGASAAAVVAAFP